MTALRHAALVVAGFSLLFGWVFARPLIDGTYLAESDLFDIFLPIFLSPRMVWSSYEFAGMPTFADPENMQFYPLHWLFSTVIGSWTGFIASAYVLGASFMYAYVYFHTRSALAGALSGVVYGLSEAMLERLPHPVIVHALAWLPLIALSLDGMRRADRRWPWVAVGACAAACCVLAGHPQLPVYIAYVCGAYALAGAVFERRGWGYLAATAAMGVLAALLAAVTLLPVAEASGLIVRQTIPLTEFTSYSNSVPQMLSLLFPAIEHVGREAPTYVGLATLVLAALGVTQLRVHWRAGFWTVVVIAALLLGTGGATPLARAVFELPLYDKFRVVARHLVFAAFGLAVLAGFGVAALQRGALSLRAGATAIAGLLVVLVAAGLVLAYWPAGFRFDSVNKEWPLPLWDSGTWTQLAIAAVAAAACFGFCRRPRSLAWGAALLVVVAGDLVHAQPHPVGAAGIAFETVSAGAIEPSVHTRRLAAAMAVERQRLLTPRGAHTNEVLHSVFARAWRIPSAGGYTSMMPQPMATLARMAMTGRVESGVLAPEDRALDLLAVKYIVINPETMTGQEQAYLANGDRWREAERFDTSRESDRAADEDAAGEVEYVIFENRRAMPRAWLAREVIPVTDGTMSDIVRASTWKDERPLDLAQMAFVLEGAAGARVYPQGPAGVSVESIEDSAISVRVSSGGGGFLVLSEAYYPGWRARIDDGDWQPVVPAFFALQGIDVAAGEHTVLFAFASGARRLGVGLSLLGVVLVGWSAVGGGTWRRGAVP